MKHSGGDPMVVWSRMSRALLADEFREEDEAASDDTEGASAESPVSSKPEASATEYPKIPAFTEYRTVVRDQKELLAAMKEGAVHIELQDQIIVLAGPYGLPPFYSLPALLSLRVRFSCVVHRCICI
jgi:hypothetical protein